MINTLRARRLFQNPRGFRFVAFLSLGILICFLHGEMLEGAEISPQRLTPMVRAVRAARPAVVNIQGQKIVTSQAQGGGEVPRQVNGMGTGVVIDPRGYILTNYHVVANVRRIEVTLDDGRSYTAQLITNDDLIDLAIIKIRTPKPLPVIRIGRSADLMEGEPVIALGNAYGYEHTVTRGIISALGRDVQVNDIQSYDDLIQTDASINPGNSGGPLLNIEGKMIGVNVAVRAGAQGIGFAIPIDKAMEVAANLLSIRKLENKWHGLVTETADQPGEPLLVKRVQSNSPAAKIGLRPGDIITQVGSLPMTRPLDLERALLNQGTGKPLPVELRRDGKTLTLQIALVRHPSASVASSRRQKNAREDHSGSETWGTFGLDLAEEPKATFQRRNTRYRGGMRVLEVRAESPAAQQGIQKGDILVGMHRWETATAQDMEYILSRSSLSQFGSLKFFVLRGQRTLFGHMDLVAQSPEHNTKRR